MLFRYNNANVIIDRRDNDLSVMRLCCAKTAKPINALLGMETFMHQKHIILDGGTANGIDEALARLEG